jgi:hypothetical protein
MSAPIEVSEAKHDNRKQQAQRKKTAAGLE